MAGKGGWLGGGRPKKPDKKVPIVTKIEPSLKAWLNSQAEIHGHTMTRWLEAAIVCLQKNREDWPQ